MGAEPAPTLYEVKGETAVAVPLINPAAYSPFSEASEIGKIGKESDLSH